MLKKLLAASALVLAAPITASADNYTPRTRYVPADPAAQRALIREATRAQRAIAMRIQRTIADLRNTERELRTVQRQLDRTTLRYNRAVVAHDVRRARRLDARIAVLRDRAETAEARRDFQRAKLEVLRADHRRAVDAVYAASGRPRLNRGG